ncbi:MAG: hypothetical protein KF861_06000, partial [Planctomycetaceae bacterium]|nr:hypothetical protein [Planctomycetaceae bacterium]
AFDGKAVGLGVDAAAVRHAEFFRGDCLPQSRRALNAATAIQSDGTLFAGHLSQPETSTKHPG